MNSRNLLAFPIRCPRRITLGGIRAPVTFVEQDAGGVGVGGVLEAAEPVTLNSERELQKKIESIARNLDPKASPSATPLLMQLLML